MAPYMDVPDLPTEQVFAALPSPLQEKTEKIVDMLSAPGLQLKKRMRNRLYGVMDEAEQQGHTEHLRRRLHRDPTHCDLSPTAIEIEFDNIVLSKFQSRMEKLEEEMESAVGEDVAKLTKTLDNIRQKMSMSQGERIQELYRKGFVKSTKEHKGRLTKFAIALTDAILEFLPDFAQEMHLDKTTVMEYVKFHDFQKALHGAPFAGNVFDKDLGATYADFTNEGDRALEMFFNACCFHNLIEGSREFGHHPHAAKALTESPACEELRQFLTGGTQDFCRTIETMADTMEASFSKRILKAANVKNVANSWLEFAAKEFCRGGSQEVPEEELVMRYRILLTNPALQTLEECNAAVTFENDAGDKQLLTTPMLKKISPIFERMALLGESI
mmetsp:Transcript_127124/g.220335  ORF Transcript_127124/g.220335 Transcript_127124/m.220335 type:complete len:386 (-) Transcript_127124:133-1290(-)